MGLRIVHTVSSLESGGMEHFVVRLVAAQRAAGHDASILSVKDGALRAPAEARGIPVTVIGPGSLPARIARTILAMRRLEPDVVHAHNPTSMQYAIFGKLVARARFVVTDHRGIYRQPTYFEWRMTDCVVGVSEDTARISAARGKAKRLIAIANGVEVKPPARARADVRTELGLAEGEVVAITVANLLPVKGYDYLIEALARVKERGVALASLAVGKGPEEEALRALAKKLGLGAERFRILGFRADVPDLLGAADLFVLPSRMEGLPLAVLEAMANRLPIVATKVGGVPEVVRDGEDGFLVPPHDPTALAEAIATLATDAAKREELGKKALERAKTDFSFDRMVARYEGLYLELVPRGRR